MARDDTDGNNDSWDESRQCVLSTLRRQRRSIHHLRGAISALVVRVAVLETKIAIYAALGGFAGSALLKILWK